MMESSGDLTIHNGNFYGAKQGLFLKSAGQVTIWNGSFKSRNPREAQQAAMVISDMENMNVTVYNGTFSGTTGIRSNVKFSLKDILPDKNGNGMKAMDNGDGFRRYSRITRITEPESDVLGILSLILRHVNADELYRRIFVTYSE